MMLPQSLLEVTQINKSSTGLPLADYRHDGTSQSVTFNNIDSSDIDSDCGMFSSFYLCSI